MIEQAPRARYRPFGRGRRPGAAFFLRRRLRSKRRRRYRGQRNRGEDCRQGAGQSAQRTPRLASLPPPPWPRSRRQRVPPRRRPRKVVTNVIRKDVGTGESGMTKAAARAERAGAAKPATKRAREGEAERERTKRELQRIRNTRTLTGGHGEAVRSADFGGERRDETVNSGDARCDDAGAALRSPCSTRPWPRGSASRPEQATPSCRRSTVPCFRRKGPIDVVVQLCGRAPRRRERADPRHQRQPYDSRAADRLLAEAASRSGFRLARVIAFAARKSAASTSPITRPSFASTRARRQALAGAPGSHVDPASSDFHINLSETVPLRRAAAVQAAG